ncbi:rsbT co-antagonist protein RsbR [Psychrobacillus sp. OK028]|uniref:STAS domain-containing protein n=1 Tax=Psychrobacillus sp. OK028 TaxID=1884359 RepID=UPI00088145C8|nr:STAS domain-containing protein [Psychrobacillus sp. OK028]SDN89744.1 rsbT co-antagonist protein RsbR [Psychrobacillus sp. OK028]
MSHLNKELFDYIMMNKSAITDAWLAQQSKDDPSYSLPQNNTYLREENGALIEAISSVYIQDQFEYLEYINNRSADVAEKRAKEKFPLFESIRSFRNVRIAYWTFVQKFIQQSPTPIAGDLVAEWSNLMNTAFDYIIENFAKYYHQYTENILATQKALITELSSSVIPIKEGIGVLPLVGNIDTERATIILESALEQSSAKKLNTIFIDLSAVPVLDTMVAQKLYQLHSALKLIGVNAIFSGIRPELAQTAVALGINFADIQSYSTLMNALKANS